MGQAALDLAQNSNVQDAFVIAVEQQARERLERLSALQKVKPVDMTKLSQQLSQESSSSSQELNGIIEDSPIYVTSVPNLSQSTGNIGAAVKTSDLISRPHHSSVGGRTFLGTNGFLDANTEHRNVSGVEEEIELKQNFSHEHRTSSSRSSGLSSRSTLPLPPVSVRETKHLTTSPKLLSQQSSDSSESDSLIEEPIPSQEVILDRSPSGSGRWGKMKHRRDDSGEVTHREMAVDVPESFKGSTKAPPKYPPPKAARNSALNYSESPRKSHATSVALKENGASNRSSGARDKLGLQENSTSFTQHPVKTPETLRATGNGVPKPAPRTTARSPVKEDNVPTESQMGRIRKYQEDIRKRREEEERIQQEQEFLRNSLRGSKKLQALEQNPPQQPVSGFVNTAFELEDVESAKRKVGDLSRSPTVLQRIIGNGELIGILQRLHGHLRTSGHNIEDENLSTVDSLLKNPQFQQALKIHNKIQKLWCFQTPPSPLCADSQELVQEVLNSLHECTHPEATELIDLLNKYEVEGLVYAHDKIAEREAIVAMFPDEELLDRASQYTEDSVKVVKIDKTNEPLGATVRNEGEAVIIGRIVKGGVAEKSGLLHEGDEILEVNGMEMRGKSVNDVCDIMANMTGTLTFLIVPSHFELPNSSSRSSVTHIKAHFDYDPEDDLYIPCRELGISFQKGDILHVQNQDDPNWWQAYREGEEDQTLAGLIPSKNFQQQREAMRLALVGDKNSQEKSKKGTLLCAKKNTKKKKKKGLYSANYNDDVDVEEILTYEEVMLYYPRANRKRPVVLIGPPNIGRHELRQKLMEDVERFAAAVPHTSRPKKDEEFDGQDYCFISRQQFEADILSRKFVEHGEYEKNYYGTSLDAIRTVVNSGKICVLNLHPQSLKILKASDLKPFIVYIAPPSLEKLKQSRAKIGITAKDDELKEIIEKAHEMEENYGHYFDLVIVNSDLERTYTQLLHEINVLDREPQWVPAAWLSNDVS
ncbi:hypothetical protein CHUAL_012301 [Chamberlinius hualienensis]